MSSTQTEVIYQNYKEAIKGERLPLLILDKGNLDHNIEDIQKRAGHLKIRIASKSIRCPSLMKYVLDNFKNYQGILCFSAEEAVFLSRQGLDDLVIAYPTNQTKAIEDVADEIAKGKKIYPMIDCAEHVMHISKVAKKKDITIPVCLEIDMSIKIPGIHFGVMRSPIRNLDDVKKVYEVIQKSSHVELKGVMGYEAEIAGLGDKNPAMGFKNPVIRLLKKRSISKINSFREKTIEFLTSEGIKLDFVNGGGTGSFEYTGLDKSVTELAMGSGLFSPLLFDYYNNFQYRPSLFFALEACRIPEEGIITCLGGGYMASGPIGIDKVPRPYLPKGLSLTENEGVGEVQTPLHLKGNNIKLGDPVFFRHSKAGEVCERFKSIHIYEKGKIIDTWPTYRGLGECYF